MVGKRNDTTDAIPLLYLATTASRGDKVWQLAESLGLLRNLMYVLTPYIRGFEDDNDRNKVFPVRHQSGTAKSTDSVTRF